MPTRLDIYLTEKQLAESRSRAQWMIENGLVTVNGKTAVKTSAPVQENDLVEITRQPEYISQGGFKLEKAARELGLAFKNKNILDIGASTGGFTDYALKHQASHVTCIDAGSDQLHLSLRTHKQVTFFENMDLRQFMPGQLPHGLPDIILADLSFISIRKVTTDLLRFCKTGTQLLVLVKPQFEMEQRRNFKNGIVPPRYHAGILRDIENDMTAKGLKLSGCSPTAGDGRNRNVEYFMLLIAAV